MNVTPDTVSHETIEALADDLIAQRPRRYKGTATNQSRNATKYCKYEFVRVGSRRIRKLSEPEIAQLRIHIQRLMDPTSSVAVPVLMRRAVV